MVTSPEFASVIDTCSMINLSLYLEACEGADLEFGASSSTVLSKLREKSGFSNGAFEKNYIKDGENLLNYLKSHYEWEIYFSLFSRSEMYRTLSERVFDELLTKAGIPFRIRKNKASRTEIKFDYEQQIIKRFEKLRERLDEVDILLIVPEKNEDIFKNLYDYVDAVSSTVSLDVFDSYVYALSLRVSAQELYSNDQEFRTIVRNINSPPTESWEGVSGKLREKIIQLHPFKGLESGDLPTNLFPLGKP